MERASAWSRLDATVATSGRAITEAPSLGDSRRSEQ